MKTIKNFVAVTTLASAFSAFAGQTVSATGATLDDAEANIAAQAEQAGASYSITSAYNNNQVHMTAKLIK